MISGKVILLRDKRPELEALPVALGWVGKQSNMGWDLQSLLKKQTKQKLNWYLVVNSFRTVILILVLVYSYYLLIVLIIILLISSSSPLLLLHIQL